MFGSRQHQWHAKTSSLSSTLLGCVVWTLRPRTMSDAAGKMQPVKVSATQIFHNFNEMTCPYSDLLKAMKGSEIKKIPSADSVLPLPGDDMIHMVSCPLAIPVPYAH
eukprot:15350632-Ditylum_brightwellii.AAC.1